MSTPFGYYVYLVRANPPHRAKQLFRVNAVGESEDDLHALFDSNLAALGDTFHREVDEAEGFRVKELLTRGRGMWVRINKGPVGAGEGETFDVDTEESLPTTVRQALLSLDPPTRFLVDGSVHW